MDGQRILGGLGGLGLRRQMGRYARLLAAALGLAPSLAGCDYLDAQLRQAGLWEPVAPGQPALLACRGDFAQFANGFMVTRPMELDFAIYWDKPAIFPLNGGSPARIITVNGLELSFEVQYEGYRAAYHLNRVDGTFSQRPNIGGVFFGRCDWKPLAPRL